MSEPEKEISPVRAAEMMRALTPDERNAAILAGGDRVIDLREAFATPVNERRH